MRVQLSPHATRLRPLLLLLSLSLAAFHCAPLRGQVFSHSPECNIGLNDQPARCSGWVRCNNPTTVTTIAASSYCNQRCPGFVVHNNARVYALANLTGIGADSQSHLGSGGGPVLKFRYTTVSCQKVKSVREGVVSECPAAPATEADLNDEIAFSDTGACGFQPNYFGNCPDGTSNNGCNGCCLDAARDQCTASGGYFYPNGGTCHQSVCEEQQYPCEDWGSWNMYLCQCTGACPGTPVLVDVAGDGFLLTDAAAGVPFDLDNDGAAERLSWTAAGADDAWLVLDRDGDGRIGKGAELFGNFTFQPHAPAGEERNGFLALSEFDRPASGGNADGVIDNRDAVFTSLRLWRDANHDGLSQPAELFTLPALDVVRLHLDYKESKRTDEHGNRFRYRAKIDGARGAKAGRWAWDVFLTRAR